MVQEEVEKKEKNPRFLDEEIPLLLEYLSHERNLKICLTENIEEIITLDCLLDILASTNKERPINLLLISEKLSLKLFQVLSLLKEADLASLHFTLDQNYLVPHSYLKSTLSYFKSLLKDNNILHLDYIDEYLLHDSCFLSKPLIQSSLIQPLSTSDGVKRTSACFYYPNLIDDYMKAAEIYLNNMNLSTNELEVTKHCISLDKLIAVPLQSQFCPFSVEDLKQKFVNLTFNGRYVARFQVFMTNECYDQRKDMILKTLSTDYYISIEKIESVHFTVSEVEDLWKNQKQFRLIKLLKLMLSEIVLGQCCDELEKLGFFCLQRYLNLPNSQLISEQDINKFCTFLSDKSILIIDKVVISKSYLATISKVLKEDFPSSAAFKTSSSFVALKKILTRYVKENKHYLKAVKDLFKTTDTNENLLLFFVKDIEPFCKKIIQNQREKERKLKLEQQKNSVKKQFKEKDDKDKVDFNLLRKYKKIFYTLYTEKYSNLETSYKYLLSTYQEVDEENNESLEGDTEEVVLFEVIDKIYFKEFEKLFEVIVKVWFSKNQPKFTDFNKLLSLSTTEKEEEDRNFVFKTKNEFESKQVKNDFDTLMKLNQQRQRQRVKVSSNKFVTFKEWLESLREFIIEKCKLRVDVVRSKQEKKQQQKLLFQSLKTRCLNMLSVSEDVSSEASNEFLLSFSVLKIFHKRRLLFPETLFVRDRSLAERLIDAQSLNEDMKTKDKVKLKQMIKNMNL